jgi:hypothetical protein
LFRSGYTQCQPWAASPLPIPVLGAAERAYEPRTRAASAPGRQPPARRRGRGASPGAGRGHWPPNPAARGPSWTPRTTPSPTQLLTGPRGRTAANIAASGPSDRAAGRIWDLDLDLELRALGGWWLVVGGCWWWLRAAGGECLCLCVCLCLWSVVSVVHRSAVGRRTTTTNNVEPSALRTVAFGLWWVPSCATCALLLVVAEVLPIGPGAPQAGFSIPRYVSRDFRNFFSGLRTPRPPGAPPGPGFLSAERGRAA